MIPDPYMLRNNIQELPQSGVIIVL